ncbi:hypothetical protein JCM11641_007687 [Rhodosporidiobolus odoratus]
MAVLFAALNTAPEYGIPHPGPVATYPYPFDPLDTNGPTKKSLATHQSSTGAGGPPLLAVLLPVFLGSFFLLAGFYGLMRWVGRTDKSQDGSTEKGQKADEGTFLVQRNKDQGTRRARQRKLGFPCLSSVDADGCLMDQPQILRCTPAVPASTTFLAVLPWSKPSTFPNRLRLIILEALRSVPKTF